MLTHIQIKNFAIIDQSELELGSGMTALTGETGAGKSILLDALGMVLGDRADSGSVRHGAARAEISASFDLHSLERVQNWLCEQELDDEQDCILRRVIGKDGRSKAFINARPVPLQTLRKLGEQLIDLHGQHEHQSLTKKEVQRQLLDDYANNDTLLKRVANEYQLWKQLNDRLQRLHHKNGSRNEAELLRYQVEELEALELSVENLQQLDEEHRRLSHAEQLINSCQSLLDQLYETEPSIHTQLSHGISELDGLSKLDSDLQPTIELLNNALIQNDEAATALRDYLSGIELDPNRLAWIEERLTTVQDLARKHHINAEQLPQRLTDLQQRLGEWDDLEHNLAALQQQLAELETQYRHHAQQLHEARCKAAKRLGTAVSASLAELGMPGGRFEVEVIELENRHFSSHGFDDVSYKVSANPGQPTKPLQKVASGGELSRISLAIQMISSQKASIPTLIFDEVDSGIGGGVAETVGGQLRALGERGQVLCVTHLPQVAAQAHHHLKVSKVLGNRSTLATVEELTAEQRVEEIARMLGGSEITAQSLAHATEMINLTQT
ncbi:MAG: DNA repair protein RecN [Gammaproteobacteria bacterium]|nr:DNA repair protein RecN [Gammaproteobacteria bacterium]